jgi:hypothetical protein
MMIPNANVRSSVYSTHVSANDPQLFVNPRGMLCNPFVPSVPENASNAQMPLWSRRIDNKKKVVKKNH